MVTKLTPEVLSDCSISSNGKEIIICFISNGTGMMLCSISNGTGMMLILFHLKWDNYYDFLDFIVLIGTVIIIAMRMYVKKNDSVRVDQRKQDRK